MTQALGTISFLDTPDVNGDLVLTAASGVAAGNVAGTANQTTVSGTTSPIVGLASNLIMPGTEGFVMPVGTTAQRPVSPVVGEQRYNTTLLEPEVYSNGAWLPGARVIQVVSGNIPVTTGTGNKTTTTAPTTGEGIALWSQVFTPLVVGSSIVVQYVITVYHGTAGRIVFTAGFAGSTCIGMTAGGISTAAFPACLSFQSVYTAPSTAAITFTARAGTLNGTNAIFVNQTSASATFGSAMVTEYRILEMIP